MRTTETIYQEMLTAYAQRRGSQLEQDCDLAVRLWAAAAQIQALEAQAEWVLGQSFPQTATGVYLDRHAAMRNMTRQAAGKAVGSLTFTLANAQTGAVNIPAGTVCMTEDAVRFQTVEDAAIPAGEISVTAAAEAVESGSSGNVGAGAVCVLTACPVAVRAVTNAEAFVGGISEESDDELRQRILDSFLRLPNGANAAWYEQTACSYEGVAAAKAVGKARGVGTVDVYVTTPDGVPPETLLSELQMVFQKSREIAVDVAVKAPSTAAVNVSVTVEVAENAEFADVKAEIEGMLAGFFSGKLLGKAVTLAELGSRIYGLPGVENRGELLYTYGVTTRKISLATMCRVLAENPAKLYGMFPRKGVLQDGADADIVVYDPQADHVLRAEDMASLAGYSPYEGFAIRGGIHQVWLRGRLAVEDGFVLAGPDGKYIPRGKCGL